MHDIDFVAYGCRSFTEDPPEHIMACGARFHGSVVTHFTQMLAPSEQQHMDPAQVGGVTRVNGNLNLSRAIGDLKYKGNQQLSASEQIITAQPDVRSVELTPEDRFLLLACDGVWDVLNNQQVTLLHLRRSRVLLDEGHLHCSNAYAESRDMRHQQPAAAAD